MKVEVPSVIGAELSENQRIKVRRQRALKIRILHHNHHHPLPSAFFIMTTTFARILTVPKDDPRRSYDGFAPHPEVPIESTSILYAMDDDEFKWSQGWIDLYWSEVDETLRIREEELRSRRVGEKRKGSGEVLEALEKKRLKVSKKLLEA